ncbi:MAG: hypothetical protein JST67_01705 [Bacteroidetes bacterium]|nr:hypothetical protein [Bacteroidota bacterium]
MKKRIVMFLWSVLVVSTLLAQSKHKIMIIPFESKLYMSQIDHRINAETKLNQKQIKDEFRRSINVELAQALKHQMECLDLLKDTIKYKKDLINIYKNIRFHYEKVPNQANYKPPVPEKNNKTANIKNGQVLNETSTEERFMNAEITNAALIPTLYAKYKTDLFLFINQLDIISTAIDEMGMTSNRSLSLHYTVYSVDAKEINSGISTVSFPSDANNPRKIASAYINKIASEIAQRIALALNKKDALPH